MDTARHLARIAIVVIAPLLLASGSTAEGANVRLIGSDVLVHDATPEQADLIEWAVTRYQRAGLSVPPLAVYFHATAGACRQESVLGFYEGGRIDLCAGVLVNAMSRHLTLHEMAHAWTEGNDSPAMIDRFLRFRGLASWNDVDAPWNERGWEQAAEFVAYGVGERIVSPNVPDPSPGQIARSYRLLTGMPIPASV